MACRSLADIGLVAATGQRSFVGTEGYVPPEGPGTPQADIFSLGKVLYEISTGKDRLDFPELDSQLSERPDKEQLLQLNDVLMKACANDSRRRYQSAEAMHNDLAALDRGESRPRKKFWPKIAIAALSIFVVGAVLFYFYESAPQHGELHLQTSVNTDPPGALVLLGDRAKRSPATFDDLEPRKYNLRIMLPGCDPVETTVDLGKNKSVALPVFHLTRSKGALEIQSDPAGAHFSLRSDDGQVSREGVMPAKVSDLPTGKYALSASRGDWEMPETVEIQRGETTRKTFAFVNGTVSVTSEPAGAEILVDGKEVGRAPLRTEIPARPHELIARLAGWPDERQSLVVGAQQENSARFVFANGSVKITSAPGGAAVLANDRELGQTPLVIEEVKPGAVTYELRLAGYKSASVTGEVAPQQQAFLAARLEKQVSPEPGQAWTNSLGMKFVPLGQVRISVWETRVQDYDAFCRATGRHYEPPDFQQAPTHPVVKVNWFDAVAFCKWLTEKEHEENVLEDRQSYRLPTDLEWSAAVGLPNEGASTRKRATEKFGMNFRGENNGRRRRAREIMPIEACNAHEERQWETTVTISRRRRRWEVSNQTRSAFTISAETFGNGAWKVTRETARAPDAIGACCAAAPGPRAIASKCNRRIATWSIATSATSFTDFVASSPRSRTPPKALRIKIQTFR